MNEKPTNVRAALNRPQMSPFQLGTLLTCFAMTLLVGMDVLVIAFAAPSISESWNISPEALGVVFSGALAGITAGALFLAPLADRVGRRILILGCTALMGTGVLATAWAQSVSALIIFRIATGLGIGGLLVTVTTLTSEYAPDRSKDFWVSLVLAGYPIGAVLTGILTASLTQDNAWRMMFGITGVATLMAIPAALLLLAESLEFLITRRPKQALARINTIMERMHAPPLDVLPPPVEQPGRSMLKDLFCGPLRAWTPLLWVAFFMTFSSLYFLLSWIPKLITDAGMPRELGIFSGTVFNVGAFVGILSAGGLALRLGLQKTILLFLSGAALLMALFDFASGSALVLVMFGIIGFAVQGGFVGLYAMAARLYPTIVRSTGIGWSMGIGRIGAVVGPIAAGFLVANGATLATSFVVFALPCLVAGLATVAIRSR